MRLQVISSNSTYYWSVTNAAPAKPYLQISNQYLPLTTATISGVKFKVQSGNTSYRACVYQSGYYNTTSSAVGNLSSTTALTCSSTSGYATGSSTVNYTTTGLLNIATHQNSSTVSILNSFRLYTIRVMTNASWTIKRVDCQTGETPAMIDDGRIWILQSANNTSNISRGYAEFTGGPSNMKYWNVYTTNWATQYVYTQWITCSNGYTYTDMVTTQSYINSGVSTIKSVALSTNQSYYTEPWLWGKKYSGNQYYRFGTTSGTHYNNAVYYGEGGTTKSKTIASTLTTYQINGVVSEPHGTSTYTSTVRVSTSTAYGTIKTFTYYNSWETECEMFQAFLSGTINTYSTKKVTTSTLTCSSTSGYSGKLSSSKWA